MSTVNTFEVTVSVDSSGLMFALKRIGSDYRDSYRSPYESTDKPTLYTMKPSDYAVDSGSIRAGLISVGSIHTGIESYTTHMILEELLRRALNGDEEAAKLFE